MIELDNNNDINLNDLIFLENVSTNADGEEFSNLIADMLIDMREAKLLDQYINNDVAECLHDN